MEGFTQNQYFMVDFDFKTKWLKIKGKDLKGKDLTVSYLFLAFLITLILVAAKFGLPKVQILF